MIGERIGKLTIVRKIGQGGIGIVYLAVREDIGNKRYAVKVLHEQFKHDPEIVRRFKAEALAAGSLDHPNIVGIQDVGERPDGSPYITMDYVEGDTLGDYCRAKGAPFSIEDVLRIIAPIADALDVAHEKGIIHRDLKPENIFLTRARTDKMPFHPVLGDWGMAKQTQRDGGSITRAGTVAGTPLYMAPEQNDDMSKVDYRADVYSLGVIVYLMITGGWFPYQRATDRNDYFQLSSARLLVMQMTATPIDPRERVASILDGVALATLAALHKDRAQRPSAGAFMRLLAQAKPGDGFSKSGVEILEEVAPRLTKIGTLAETLDAKKAAAKPAVSKYRRGARLGAGGMAEVYVATLIGLEGFQRPVAIKRVLPGFSEIPQFASMIIDEARLAAKLSHPNVVSVVDFDRDEDGRLFLAMELVEGRDLATVAATGQLPVSTIVHVMIEVLHGLGYAHELPLGGEIRGIVHRDVSPQNVLVSWEGAVKVSDFGIAKARRATAASASVLVKGKPQYMSPEQATGGRLDGRSDLFAVGVMLWELLTGEHLFDGTTEETLAQVMLKPIPPPSTRRPGIPHDLEAVTMRLLKREPENRFANAQHAWEALQACACAPRNGIDGLVQLLAARFPAEVAARSSRPPIVSEHAPNERVTIQAKPTRKDGPGTWQQSPSTNASAASQSITPVPVPKRNLMAWVASVAVIGACAVIGVVGASYRRQHNRGDDSTTIHASGITPAVAPTPPPLDERTALPTNTAPPPSVPSETNGSSNRASMASTTVVTESHASASTTTTAPTTATTSTPAKSKPSASAVTESPKPLHVAPPVVQPPPSAKAIAKAPTARPTETPHAPPAPPAGSAKRFDPDDVGGD